VPLALPSQGPDAFRNVRLAHMGSVQNVVGFRLPSMPSMVFRLLMILATPVGQGVKPIDDHNMAG
jgi:hypothetical protein